jgi:hypothetical protein
LERVGKKERLQEQGSLVNTLENLQLGDIISCYTHALDASLWIDEVLVLHVG